MDWHPYCIPTPKHLQEPINLFPTHSFYYPKPYFLGILQLKLGKEKKKRDQIVKSSFFSFTVFNCLLKGIQASGV